MGDAHQVVVDHVGQEVRRQAVGLHQHLHVHAVPRDLDVTAQHVRHHAHAFARHFHADNVRLAGSQALGHFFFREQQRAAVIAWGFATRLLLGAHLVQLFGGAEARESMAHVDQLLGVLLVDLAALALAIRAVRATDVRAFRPGNAQPAQCIKNLLLRLTGRTQLIGVFDPQDEFTAVLLGKAVVEQGDVSSADVGIPSRRWRNARADGGHGRSRMGDKTENSNKGRMVTAWGAWAPAWVILVDRGAALREQARSHIRPHSHAGNRSTVGAGLLAKRPSPPLPIKQPTTAPATCRSRPVSAQRLRTQDPAPAGTSSLPTAGYAW